MSFKNLAAHWVALSVLFFSGPWAVFFVLGQSVDLPTLHLDGAYQTASGLYRLAGGHLPGRDFFPYLGVGPLYLLYPFFALFGGNLAASGAACRLVILATGSGSAALVWHWIWKPRSFLSAWAAGQLCCLLVAALTANEALTLPAAWAASVTPGYSLRPLRWAVPYGVAALHSFGLCRLRRLPTRLLGYGAAGALALCWSNDYGLSTATLTGLLMAAGTRRWRHVPWHLVAYALAVGAMGIFWLNLLTYGNAFALWQYNLRDVAGDQWWYFAPYDRFARIFSWRDLGRLGKPQMLLSLAVWLTTVAVAHRRRDRQLWTLAWVGLALLAGGMVASVGGHLGSYFGGLHAWALATAAVGLCRILSALLAPWWRLQLAGRGASLNLALQVGAVALCVGLGTEQVAQTLQRRQAADADPERFYVAELGGWLPCSWQSYVQLARVTPRQTRVVEEYWGLWSALRRALPPWRVDAVIHALGHERERASAALQQAQLIISSTKQSAGIWQPWSLSENYWFYRPLLWGWTPHVASPHTLLWRPAAHAPRGGPPLPCHVAMAPRPHLQLEVPSPGFYEVTLHPRWHGSRRVLLLADNHLNFAGGMPGQLSLDPSATEARFVAYLDARLPGELELSVIGGCARDLALEGCEVRALPPTSADVLSPPPRPSREFFVTDEGWEQGRSRQGSCFFVPNEHLYRRAYRRGRRVVFADGQTRVVRGSKQASTRLLVSVSGAALGGAGLGCPCDWRLLDEGGLAVRNLWSSEPS